MTAHLDRFVLDRLPPPDLLPEFLFELPELAYPETLNAAAVLIGRGAPDALAVISDDGRWTYGEMAALSDRIARLLTEEEGLVPGNRVLLRSPNSAFLFAAWLGVLKAGGVVVATMPILRAAEIGTILDRAQVSHAIVDRACLEDYLPAAAQAVSSPRLLVHDGDTGGGPLEARLAGIAPGFAAVATRADDPALIAFTSGTTGRPKGCIQFHRDILAPADSFSRHVLRPQPGWRWACSAPIAFTFGLGMQVIFPFASGGTAVTVAGHGPKALLDCVERHGVSVMATAPTAYKAMLPHVAAADLSSLRLCVSAGEHLPAATWRAWEAATGHRIVEGIGATEMMHIFISAAGDDIRPGTTGRAVPGYRATVLDDGGRPMASGTGRLAVKGPTGCRYLSDERQRAYVENGWNVTGDTYSLDADGYFTYVARSDDMIISSGYNIGAPEVENALLTHEAVMECAVIGVPCEARGQRVKAFIVCASGHGPSPELARALQDHVKAAIAPYKYPREIAFVDALPKTPTGKLQRHALRQTRTTPTEAAR